MAHTYSKLFSQIVGSTIWAEDHSTRIVWITLLALKDRYGEVNGTPVGLARIANVSLEECNAALALFLAPEPSKHDDGRRIEEIEHGWFILNHDKYQRLASKEDSVEKNAERQRRFKKRHSVTVTKANAPVTVANGQVTQDRYISDAEVDVDVEAKKEMITPNGVVASATDEVAQAFRLFNDSAARTGWPAVQKLDADRKKAMAARLKEVAGIEGFAIALGKAEASEFLTVTWPNFNLDWLLKPKNFRKLMEGNYDKRNPDRPDERSLAAGLAGLFEAGSR